MYWVYCYKITNLKKKKSSNPKILFRNKTEGNPDKSVALNSFR